MFDNMDDCRRYLNGSVCFINDEPVYVSGFDRWSAVCYNLPLGDKTTMQDVRDSAFRASKYKLGYVNRANGDVFYTERWPARIQAQGLCAANLAVVVNGETRMMGRAMFDRDCLRDKGFRDMLCGKYPSIDEARKMLLGNKGARAVAFGPHHAIRRHEQFSNLYFLEYKGRPISHSQTGEFSLCEEFQYLEEVCSRAQCLERKERA